MPDWRRMAVPQEDGYDVTELNEIRKRKWRGTVTPGQHQFWGMYLKEGAPSYMASYRVAPLQGAEVKAVGAILEKVPLYARALRFIDFFTPMNDPRMGKGGHGCSSGHVHPNKTGLLEIFVTVDSPDGGAEGVLHEAAHLRLITMGINVESTPKWPSHDGTLLENDHEPRYFSPVRRDCLRPMTALLHAIYAWTFMLEVDVAASALHPLSINVPKVEMGLETIKQNAQPTAEGRAFLNAYYRWAEEVLARASARLEATNTERVPVPES